MVHVISWGPYTRSCGKTQSDKDVTLFVLTIRNAGPPLYIKIEFSFYFTLANQEKEAMRKAEAAGNDDCPVKIELVAPPTYVLNTQTLDKILFCFFWKEHGIAILTKVLAEEIERSKENLLSRRIQER